MAGFKKTYKDKNVLKLSVMPKIIQQWVLTKILYLVGKKENGGFTNKKT